TSLSAETAGDIDRHTTSTYTSGRGMAPFCQSVMERAVSVLTAPTRRRRGSPLPPIQIETMLPINSTLRAAFDGLQPAPADDVAARMDEAPIGGELPAPRIAVGEDPRLRRQMRATAAVVSDEKVHCGQHARRQRASDDKFVRWVERQVA